MSRIFISYRRSDSIDATGRIHDQLNAYFGADETFRDIDLLRAGNNFPSELRTALEHSAVMLVIIGDGWLQARGANGQGLDDANDFVRTEIKMALALEIPIIPVLVRDATMPPVKSLPEELWPMVFIQAVNLPSGQGFGTGMERLVRRIQEIGGIASENYLAALRDCQRTGLVLIKGNFREDGTVLAEMEESKELLVVMNDGRGWLDQNKEIVLDRLRDAKKMTRVVLLHPAAPFLEVLVKKNGKTLALQRGDIERTYRTLRATAKSQRRLQIKGHYGFNGYSLTMGSRYAYLSPYLYNESGALPLLRFSSQPRSGIYHQLKADALSLFEKAEPLTDQSFQF